MTRTRGLWLPLVLIAIGVIVLLSNTGVLSADALERLGDLWPLLLVIIGLQLILNHALPRQQATIFGLAATALIIVAAVAYATLAPATSFGTQHAESSQPVGGLTSGTLDLNYSAANLEIQSGGLGDSLYRATVDYPAGDSPPTMSLDHVTGTVEISSGSSFTPFHLFGNNRRHLAVTLNDRILWTIRISGGASGVHLDLRQLQLSNLEISGGASSVDAQLGKPKGSVGIHVSGGASNVVVRAPSGSEWSVSVSGGISSLTVNGQSSGGLGDFHRQSPGYDAATDRFDIEMNGGVSHLDFHTG
jgi:hypothetical protein